MRREGITQIINGQASGPYPDDTMSEIYRQLRACVRHVLARESQIGSGPRVRQDLTMIVHECWLKLQRTEKWDNRAHFFGSASRATRQILIDIARARARRPKHTTHSDMNSPTAPVADSGSQDCDRMVSIVDTLLTELARTAPRAARVGGYRLFGDLPNEVIAEIEEVNIRTVQRDWNFCRAWLASRHELITDDPYCSRSCRRARRSTHESL